MELLTSRLILRRWRPSDREPFAGINADPTVMEFMPALLSRTEKDASIDRAEAHLAQHGFGPLRRGAALRWHAGGLCSADGAVV